MCLPLTLVTHILSGVTHVERVEIELEGKRLQFAFVKTVKSAHIFKHAIFCRLRSSAQQVCVHTRVCEGQFMAWLCHNLLSLLSPTESKPTNILLESIVLNKNAHGTLTLYTARNLLFPLHPPNKTQHKVVTQKGHQRVSQHKKKSEGVSICPVSVRHLTRQLSRPSRLGLSHSFGVVWCAAVHVCVCCTLL